MHTILFVVECGPSIVVSVGIIKFADDYNMSLKKNVQRYTN